MAFSFSGSGEGSFPARAQAVLGDVTADQTFANLQERAGTLDVPQYMSSAQKLIALRTGKFLSEALNQPVVLRGLYARMIVLTREQTRDAQLIHDRPNLVPERHASVSRDFHSRLHDLHAVTRATYQRKSDMEHGTWLPSIARKAIESSFEATLLKIRVQQGLQQELIEQREQLTQAHPNNAQFIVENLKGLASYTRLVSSRERSYLAQAREAYVVARVFGRGKMTLKPIFDAQIAKLDLDAQERDVPRVAPEIHQALALGRLDQLRGQYPKIADSLSQALGETTTLEGDRYIVSSPLLRWAKAQAELTRWQQAFTAQLEDKNLAIHAYDAAVNILKAQRRLEHAEYALQQKLVTIPEIRVAMLTKVLINHSELGRETNFFTFHSSPEELERELRTALGILAPLYGFRVPESKAEKVVYGFAEGMNFAIRQVNTVEESLVGRRLLTEYPKNFPIFNRVNYEAWAGEMQKQGIQMYTYDEVMDQNRNDAHWADFVESMQLTPEKLTAFLRERRVISATEEPRQSIWWKNLLVLSSMGGRLESVMRNAMQVYPQETMYAATRENLNPELALLAMQYKLAVAKMLAAHLKHVMQDGYGNDVQPLVERFTTPTGKLLARIGRTFASLAIPTI